MKIPSRVLVRRHEQVDTRSRTGRPCGDEGRQKDDCGRRSVWAEFLQPNAFYLTQCNLVLCSVVQFRCSRGSVSRHLLRVLQPSVVFQVNSDPGCPPGVTSNGGEKG
jgi:hypothetical protein